MSATTQLTETSLSFEQKLDRLAAVAVNAGLGLQRGQELVMTATLHALPLARLITEQAYKAGASLVTTLFTDEHSTLLRYRYGSDDGFDKAAGWLYDGMAEAFRSGAARLAIAGGNPSLLSKEDPEKVGRANRAVSKAYRPALELITRHDINWTIVACPTSKRWPSYGTPSLPHRVRTWTIPSRVGNNMTPGCIAVRICSTKSVTPRSIFVDRGPISAWDWRTITFGWAEARTRAMERIAFQICPRKRFSPRRTKIA
jgi:hypothetical protein